MGEKNSDMKWSNDYCRAGLSSTTSSIDKIQSLSEQLLNIIDLDKKSVHEKRMLEKEILRKLKHLGNRLKHYNAYSSKIQENFLHKSLPEI